MSDGLVSLCRQKISQRWGHGNLNPISLDLTNIHQSRGGKRKDQDCFTHRMVMRSVPSVAFPRTISLHTSRFGPSNPAATNKRRSPNPTATAFLRSPRRPFGPWSPVPIVAFDLAESAHCRIHCHAFDERRNGGFRSIVDRLPCLITGASSSHAEHRAAQHRRWDGRRSWT